MIKKWFERFLSEPSQPPENDEPAPIDDTWRRQRFLHEDLDRVLSRVGREDLIGVDLGQENYLIAVPVLKGLLERLNGLSDRIDRLEQLTNNIGRRF